MRWDQVLTSKYRKQLDEREPRTWGQNTRYVGGGALGQALAGVNAFVNDPDDEREWARQQAELDRMSAADITNADDPEAQAFANDDGYPAAPDIEGDPVSGSASGSISSAGVSASQDLITMLKGFEGYGRKVNPSQGDRSNVIPYWDVRQWSIGYGSYAGSRDRRRRPNMEWTPQQAEAELMRQLRPYRANVQGINRRGGYRWTQEQIDALTSFAYNIGSIDELTNRARRSNREIADAMMRYVRADGRRVSGLVTRRRIERQKFLAGMAQGRLDYRPGRST